MLGFGTCGSLRQSKSTQSPPIESPMLRFKPLFWVLLDLDQYTKFLTLPLIQFNCAREKGSNNSVEIGLLLAPKHTKLHYRNCMQPKYSCENDACIITFYELDRRKKRKRRRKLSLLSGKRPRSYQIEDKPVVAQWNWKSWGAILHVFSHSRATSSHVQVLWCLHSTYQGHNTSPSW